MAPRHRSPLTQASPPRARWYREGAVVRAHALSVAPLDVARSAPLVSPRAFASALQRYSRRPESPFDGARWTVTFHSDSADSNALILELLNRNAHTDTATMDVVFGVDSTPAVPTGSVVMVHNGPNAVALAALVDLIDDCLVDDRGRSARVFTAAAHDLQSCTLRSVDEFGYGPSAPQIRTAMPTDSIVLGLPVSVLDDLAQSFGQVGVGDVVARIATDSWRRTARPTPTPNAPTRPSFDVAVEDVDVVHITNEGSDRVRASRIYGTFGPHEHVRTAAVSLTLSPTPAVRDQMPLLTVFVEVHPSAGISAPEFARALLSALAELRATASRGFTRLNKRSIVPVEHVA